MCLCETCFLSSATATAPAKVTDQQRSLNFAIEQINSEIAFVLHKVTSDFSSLSSFSTLDLRLAAHVNDAQQGQMAIRVKDLFKVEAVNSGTSALEFIAHSRKKIWPPVYPSTTKPKETDIMISLSTQIFVPLCSEVLLESRYATILERHRLPELQVGDSGLGSVDTWHGTPDARIRGMEVVWRKDAGDAFAVVDEEDVSEDEGSVQSDGKCTAVEGKVLTTEANMAQAVGTCVVASFTAKARHPEQKALVPTVLLDEKQFRVCLYDCEKDIVLSSTNKMLATKGKLSRSGMALLWLVINHR